MRRLPLPVSLAVALIGSATCVSLWYGGCQTTTDPIDAGRLQQLRPDALVSDTAVDAGAPDGTGP